MQIGLGTLTAHYTVEGQHFYGFPLADYLPYAVTRTWHTQIAMFWIATAWLATGLYIAPAVGGRRSARFQTLGVNLLFVALLIVVVGSLAGEWFGVQQKMGLKCELLVRPPGLRVRRPRPLLADPAVRRPAAVAAAGRPRAVAGDAQAAATASSLIASVFVSTVAIALFYAAGSGLGPAHPPVDDRVLALVGGPPVGGGLLRGLRHRRHRPAVHEAGPGPGRRWRRSPVLFSAIIFLSGGIIGTLHHLYWSGTPASVMALGAVVSALEVVPLVLLGLEGYHNYRFTRTAPWVAAYRWPILFFVAVAFWNMLGAGVFGFLINPPISLYYIQGLNTTAVHAHAALFGVYGMLGIGLMLFCLRGMTHHGGLGRPAAEVGLLGPEHRPGDDAVPVAAADRRHPGLGRGRRRLLVRPLGRRGAVAAGPHPGLDAGAGRHRLRRWARC